MSFKLSYDQEEVLRQLVEEARTNFLILGPAGCGKTLLRRRYVEVNPRCLVLGTTGASLAGTDNSYTVSRFSCLKRKKFELPPSVIVEECSMMNSYDLEHLNRKLKSYGTTQLFGGVQLLLFGDVLQLPPVTGQYFFTGNLFRQGKFKVVVLRENFRQQDEQLKTFCRELRYGGLANPNMLLEYRRRPPRFTPTICATQRVVNEHNSRCLKHWKGNSVQVGRHSWKVGVPVVVTRNIYDKIRMVVANGTFGTLNENGEFCEEGKAPLRIHPKHLALNFAMTVHRAQGKTMSAVAIDGKGGMFAPHQLYVAVSRAKFWKNCT